MHETMQQDRLHKLMRLISCALNLCASQSMVFFNKDMYFLVYNVETVKIEKFDLAPLSQNASNW